MNIVTLDTLRGLFDRTLILQKIRQALEDHAAGIVQSPPPGQLLFESPPGDCHVKFGCRAGAPTFAVKIATGFYDNPRNGLPVNQGLILVFDSNTGTPLTLLLDEGWLTAWRTTAAVALAATELAPQPISSVAVLGAGLQASLALEWIGALRPAWKRALWARDARKAEQLARRLEVTSETDLGQLVSRSDIVITATPSRAPLFSSELAQPGQLFIGVGADSTGKHELPTELFAQAESVVVDDRNQAHDHGDWGAAVRARHSHAGKAVLLGDVLAGRVALPSSGSGCTIVDLTGVAAQDIAIAELFTGLLEEAGNASRMDR